MTTIAKVGAVFPAKRNTSVSNPGPVNDEQGNALDPWLLAQQQDTAYKKNLVLKEECESQLQASPDYGMRLAKMKSWGVVVIEAEAGGVTFDLQRVGDIVASL